MRPTRDEIAARAHQLYLARGATDGDDVKDWLQAERELIREHRRHLNTYAPWAAALATIVVTGASVWIASRAYYLSERLRAEAFEPRVIVSTLAPLDFEEVTDAATGWRHSMVKSGRLSLRNVGSGDAIDVRCHIVNPFSEIERPYAYHRFRSEPWTLLLCSGEAIDEGFKRERAFGSVLAKGEEQQFCVQDLDMDPTRFESFLVVRCTYSDKDGTPKGGDLQEVALPSGFMYSSAEADTPAKEIFARYQSDPRVQRVRKQRRPSTASPMPVKPTPPDGSPSSHTPTATPP